MSRGREIRVPLLLVTNLAEQRSRQRWLLRGSLGFLERDDSARKQPLAAVQVRSSLFMHGEEVLKRRGIRVLQRGESSAAVMGSGVSWSDRVAQLLSKEHRLRGCPCKGPREV